MMARQLGCGQVPKVISSWISQTQRGYQGIHRCKKNFWV
jgi:hypothetical protein